MWANSAAHDAAHKQARSCDAVTAAAQDAAIVGYRSREAGGALRMNPLDDDTLGAGDAIVALAETGAERMQHMRDKPCGTCQDAFISPHKKATLKDRVN